MRKIPLCVLFFVIPFFSVSPLFGQNWEERFIPTSTQEGMANLTVTSIIQDRYGYMWFGTKNGLHRYNGHEFEIFINDPGDTNSISGNSVLCLVEDQNGMIWAGTESNGLNRINPITGDVRRFLHDEKNKKSISSNEIYGLCLDDENRIWIGTKNHGFCVYNKGEFERFTQNSDDPNSISKGTIWHIMQGSKGYMWISTWGGGLHRFDYENRKFTKYQHDSLDPKSIADNMVGPVYEGTEGNLWITSWGGGMDCFNPETETFTHYKKGLDSLHSITDNLLWPVVQDQSGIIWLGTYGSGLDRLNPKTGELKNFHYDPKHPRKFLHNNIWSLYIDRDNILWIGTEGGGVMRYTGIKKPFHTIRTKLEDGSISDHELVRSVTVGKDEDLWIGTWYHGLIRCDHESGEMKSYFRSDRKGQAEIGINQIRTLMTDDEGLIWVGSNREGLYVIDPKTDSITDYSHDPNDKSTICNNNIKCLLQDRDKNIWVGTAHGLNRINKKTGTIKRFTYDQSNPSGIPKGSINVLANGENGTLWIGSNFGLYKLNTTNEKFEKVSDENDLSHDAVQDIYRDTDGLIWIGTRRGLNVYDPSGDKFKLYKLHNRKSQNNINSIEEDGRNNLWLSTNYGLLRFDKENEVFSIFDQEEGVKILSYAVGASCREKDGTMYFAGTGGITWLHPNEIGTNKNAPKMLITSVIKNGAKFNTDKPLSEVDKIVVPYSGNSISISYIGFSYADPEKTRYAYILEGYEDQWNHGGHLREAHYSGLVPGSYRFKVKAVNEDGVWSDEATLNILIPVPYWQKWWFYLICILVFVVLVYALVRIRMRKLEKEKKVLESIVAERTAEVVQQKDEIEMQHALLEETHKEIQDSIGYAQRLQAAILPSFEDVRQGIPDNFIMFRPKDVVSGDFYWYERVDGITFIAAADCTGHGVPGAMVSVVCSNALNRTVNEFGITEPAKILDKTREIVINTFAKSGEGVKDGMDIALCAISGKKILFAGANNPLWIVRKTDLLTDEEKEEKRNLIDDDYSLIEFKGSKQPVGLYQEMEDFEQIEVNLKEGDTFYIFSDGFADQFGGDKGKKLKYKPFKRILIEVSQDPLDIQCQRIETAFEEWMGDFEQIDDVCLIGVRV